MTGTQAEWLTSLTLNETRNLFNMVTVTAKTDRTKIAMIK